MNPPPFSPDLAQITWASGDVTRFEVRGEQPVQHVLHTVPGTGVSIASHADVGHDAVNRQVAVFLSVSIGVGRPAEPAADISGQFELRFVFTVENLAEMLRAEDSAESATRQLHPQLLLLLSSVAYSTARGILWTRLAGTPLEGVTLPLIDPRQLLLPTAPAGPPGKKPRAASARRSGAAKKAG